MDRPGRNIGERPTPEPEIIPPGAPDPRVYRREFPGGVFFEMRGGEGAVHLSRAGKFKLALWAILIFALVLALVLTFASLFVIAAIVSACVAALAVVVAWLRGMFGKAAR